jgi:hypothetical protein
MSRAEIFASELRDQAMRIVMERGSITVAAPGLSNPKSTADLKSSTGAANSEHIPNSKSSTGTPNTEQHTFRDARLRIEFWPGPPCALDVFKIGDGERRVFGQIWNPDGDAVTVVHQHGSWEDILARVAKAC